MQLWHRSRYPSFPLKNSKQETVEMIDNMKVVSKLNLNLNSRMEDPPPLELEQGV